MIADARHYDFRVIMLRQRERHILIPILADAIAPMLLSPRLLHSMPLSFPQQLP